MASLSMPMPSSATATSTSTTASTPITNLKQSEPSSSSTPAVKPCCVCKAEKASRDECMLFSNAPDPQGDCATTIDKYRTCMAGFGFKLP